MLIIMEKQEALSSKFKDNCWLFNEILGKLEKVILVANSRYLIKYSIENYKNNIDEAIEYVKFEK